MLKSIDLMYQTMLAELGQRSLDAAWSADYPSDSRFTPLTVNSDDIGSSIGQNGRVAQERNPNDGP